VPVEYRWAQGHYERLTALVAGLIDRSGGMIGLTSPCGRSGSLRNQKRGLRNAIREFCGSPNALIKCESSRMSQSSSIVWR
jgi:hypothetical protein